MIPERVKPGAPGFFLIVACVLSVASHGGKGQVNDYGRPNPDAPKELSQFAFIIGEWRCEVRVKNPNGSFERFDASWIGRYALDGYMIVDEYRRYGPDGDLVQCGQNFRSYNSSHGWVMRWYDALAATWMELGPEDLGGVLVRGSEITFQHHVETGGRVRATFENISGEHFTWRGEYSRDGKRWEEVMVIESHRVDG